MKKFVGFSILYSVGFYVAFKLTKSTIAGGLFLLINNLVLIIFASYSHYMDSERLRNNIKEKDSKCEKQILKMKEEYESTFQEEWNKLVKQLPKKKRIVLQTQGNTQEPINNNKDYKDRLNIFDKKCQNIHEGIISIDKNISWNYRKSPHALCCGQTGGGKTYFLLYLIRTILLSGGKLSIIDPKKSDLSYLENILDNVVCSNVDTLRLLKKTVAAMENRFEQFKLLPDYTFGKDYADYGFKPHFLIFDEVMSFFGGSAENKMKIAAKNCLLDLIAKGRQAGFFVVLTTQRPDVKFIDGAIRDQLGLRVSLGKLSSDGYKMVFDKTSLQSTILEKGSGFVYIDGTNMEIQEFMSPEIPKEYDFISDLKKILNKQKYKKNTQNLIKTVKIS
jgi:hypothetical protein